MCVILHEELLGVVLLSLAIELSYSQFLVSQQSSHVLSLEGEDKDVLRQDEI
jgi:hypothetical protein